MIPVGVIGTGHLGSLHAKMFSEIGTASLVGVYDIDPEHARRAAADAKTTAFAELDALLATVKAVSIATPTRTHAAIAAKAIERGLHVFIEKPVTATIPEAHALLKLAGERKVLVQVGHIERFNPALLALEKYLLEPMFVESHRLAQFNPRGTDVAVVLDLMIHDIDIIQSLVKSPVRSIEANGVAVVSDTVDIANARIQFENGCVANVTASRISQKKMRKMRLFQRDAYISVDFSEGVAEVFRLQDGDAPGAGMMLGAIESGSRRRSVLYEQPEVPAVNALKYELELFLDAVAGGSTPVVSGEDGLRALETAHEIMKKIEQQGLKIQ
jgi:predicted dehydrogenase